MRKEYPLSAITKNITDGKHGDCRNQESSGYYFISVKDMGKFAIDYSNARQIAEEDFIDSNKRTKLEVGDTIIANSGHTIGKMLFVDENPNVSKTTFQKSVAIIKPDKEIVSDRFLFYALLADVQRLRRAAVGSAQKNLLLDDMRKFKLKIYDDKKIQLNITEVLLSLDEKIKTNNLINAELEALAKTIYDYWFIQFDFPDEHGNPYKSSGGKMIWNDKLKKEIPDGWLVKEMHELLIKNTTRFDFSNTNHDLDTIDLSVMPSATICLNEKNSSSSFGTNLFKLSVYDILFGGIRPYLLKAGFAPFDGLVTGTVHSFKVREENEYNFSLLTMSHTSMFTHAVSNSKGTKMPVIGADDLLAYKLAYNKEIVARFNQILSFREIIAQNIVENHQLAELRDWLLPMLMNGQVTFNKRESERV